MTILVSGNTFEGNVVWQLLTTQDRPVDNGYLTTSQGSWTQGPVHLGSLAPGQYIFRAYEGGGRDGSAIHVDDKAFTVE